MKLSEKEKAENRASFAAMRPLQKVEYIFTYYKPLLLFIAVSLFLLVSGTYRALTHRDALLYTALANISVGETLEEALGDGFIAAIGENPRKSEVYLYRGLYLSRDAAQQDHQYAYASQLKTLASITAKKLDVALMNREAYDLMSQSGYLLPLPELLTQDAALLARLSPYLTENAVILKDNAIEYNLSEAETYEAVTTQSVNALALGAFPLFREAGFSGEVYLGVIGNSPRLDMALAYIDYLTADPRGM